MNQIIKSTSDFHKKNGHILHLKSRQFRNFRDKTRNFRDKTLPFWKKPSRATCVISGEMSE